MSLKFSELCYQTRIINIIVWLRKLAIQRMTSSKGYRTVPRTKKHVYPKAKEKEPYSFYVTRVIGLQHTLLSLCCPQKIGALIVKIQNFQAFRYYPISH